MGVFFWGYVFLCIATAYLVFEVILLWFLRSDLLSCFLFLISNLCAVMCLFIFFVGVVWEKAWLRYTLCFFWAIFIIWAQWTIIPEIPIYVHHRQLAKNEHTILQLVSEIESLHSQKGRLPENESELVKLRGQAMPLSTWKTPLKYLYLKDPNGPAYIIETHGPDYGQQLWYNSRYPDAGVFHD